MNLFGHQITPQSFTLRAIVNKLENAIITLSGPAIAISGIIAGIDLLTGGSMFKDVHWLSLTWAICLLLTLDFQVLMLGARARRVYGSDKGAGRKFWEILIVLLIAAAISSVSVQMQSIIARSQATVTYTDRAGQHVRNLTIDEATQQMGINPVALIWERSALVLILIFMSGWFRDEDSQQNNQNQAPAAPEIDYQAIAQQIIPLLQPALSGLKTTIIAEIKPLIPAPVPAPQLDYSAIASAIAPLLPAPEPAPQPDHQAIARAVAPLLAPRVEAIRTTIIEEIKATIAPLVEAPAPAPQITARASAAERSQEQGQRQARPEPATNEEREAQLEAAYQELRTANDGKRISGRQLADKVHMNRRTVTEWLKANHPENEAGAITSDLDAEPIPSPEPAPVSAEPAPQPSAGATMQSQESEPEPAPQPSATTRKQDTEELPAYVLDSEPELAGASTK